MRSWALGWMFIVKAHAIYFAFEHRTSRLAAAAVFVYAFGRKKKKRPRIRFSDIAPGRARETFSARCEVIARTPSLSAIGK